MDKSEVCVVLDRHDSIDTIDREHIPPPHSREGESKGPLDGVDGRIHMTCTPQLRMTKAKAGHQTNNREKYC